MSAFYNPKRSRNLYLPDADVPFKLSRSKLELFSECPRCFYIDRRLGTGRPPGYPFNLNSAVDSLLKTEFDVHRAAGTAHPLQAEYGIDAVPAPHAELDDWRQNFRGVRYLHESTNLLVFGAIDDLWIDSQGNYLVVDYKATAKKEPVTSIDSPWQRGYKRQMEIYQWLLRRNGLSVSDTGYFVYCTGRPDAQAFDARIDFDVHVIAYEGDDGWVEEAIVAAHRCLNAGEVPEPGKDCDYCAYVAAVDDAIRDHRS
ncbi:MAG: PD-(D/E)XK nuclease family protein [Woeseiaceae bacterium]|nr:PD-(D/E)XK nuclease family protein [Woeseiaceae bacterium]